MSAGLPGVGLSGLFFIVSALLMLPVEIVRTVRGQSSLARWLVVLRHQFLAVGMIIALELAYSLLSLSLSLLGQRRAHNGMHMLPMAPVLATLGLIACFILLAKAAQLISRRRQQPGPVIAQSELS